MQMGPQFMKTQLARHASAISVTAAALVAGMFYLYATKDRRQPEPPPPASLSLACTIFPLFDMAKNVAGPEAEVHLIVPPGASPHFFEFAPRQVRALQGVKVVFAIGHGLDDWVGQITNAIPGSRVFVVDQDIALHQTSDGSTDPHYWMNLRNAQSITTNIARELAALDPAHADLYKGNAGTYNRKLAAKDSELHAVLGPARGTPILTFHDAWFYFANDFGLTVTGALLPASSQEPTPRYLAGLRERVRSDRIRVLFLEPQFAATALGNFARDNRLRIAELDPLGGTAGRATYLELMTFNANSVRDACLQRE